MDTIEQSGPSETPTRSRQKIEVDVQDMTKGAVAMQSWLTCYLCFPCILVQAFCDKTADGILRGSCADWDGRKIPSYEC